MDNIIWEKLDEEHKQVGYRRLITKTFRLPDGKVDTYDIKNEGQAACIVAMTVDQQILLVESYRPGPEKLVKDLPGGFVEVGEDPKKAAARELLEETGYVGDLELVGTSLDDAYSNLLRYNFVARNCKKVAEPKGDDDEFGRLVLMTIDAFRAHLRSGELTDIETGYLGLDHLRLL